jgi:triacylglycerol lipase
MRFFGWWRGLAPRRRAVLGAVMLIVVAGATVAGVQGSRGPQAQAMPNPARPGTVLLVPGYGGSTTALDVLATRIRAAGRAATVVQLAGNGTGDLRAQAAVLNGYVNQAVRGGSGPVTVIGYSAGGVVAWLWDVSYDGAARASRIITLGSPLHGARIAAIGSALVPGECPEACQQLAPGSSLLTWLQATPQADRPPWLSLWTTNDQVVQPPSSASLPGAINIPLQSICPSVVIQHGQLPTAPLVVGIVLRALTGPQLRAPAPGECATLQSLGS